MVTSMVPLITIEAQIVLMMRGDLVRGEALDHQRWLTRGGREQWWK